MGRLFIWMNKPDPGIPDNSWQGFLDGMAAILAVVVLISVVLTILGYVAAAKRRKVYFPADLFAPFTPMYWIFLAVPSALVVGALAFWQYARVLDSTLGRLGVSLQIALLSGTLTAIVSYVLIAFVPQFTPEKFRYRPAPYLHKKRSTGAEPI